MPAYKSYCWSIGTTSFRMVEFNKKIEQQLKLLNDFWQTQAAWQKWSGNSFVQEAYYNFMKEQAFIEDKNATRKDKDARQKTSGLVDLGLIDQERRLTEVGQSLLDIAERGTFEKDNILHISADSFIYFKQLLKLSYKFENETVRPYVVLVYMLAELGAISKEEFTYLVPLAIDRIKTVKIIKSIKEIRENETHIENVISSILLEMPNYQEAEKIFVSANIVDKELIQQIGMNRKSKEYDIPYLDLYISLKEFHKNADNETVLKLFNAIDKLSGRARLYWKSFLFNTNSPKSVKLNGVKTLHKDRLILEENDEVKFKKEFFKLLHVFKAKSLLDDYYDLNKRYFQTSDTILFQDSTVQLDIIPHCYFSCIKEKLLDFAFTTTETLHKNCELPTIHLSLDVQQEAIIEQVNRLYGVQAQNLSDIQQFIDEDRYKRLNKMIDARFDDERIIELMDMFEKRHDNDIQTIVTNNADVPTIFEYILAIAWYKISERQGNILEAMHLSLDADLLPKSHAGPNHADIAYKYGTTEVYPEHTLIIEATLANKTNQRRMEMEPVSRHLGNYLLEHPNESTYCLFATTFLHVNVISDFRMRRTGEYYSMDGSECVHGMKIIPFQTSEIKLILQKKLTYKQLYPIFEQAFQTNTAPNLWYKQEIVDRL